MGGCGKTVVALLAGRTITADLYLPLYRIRLDNRSLPAARRDGSGKLALDRNLRVIDMDNV